MLENCIFRPLIFRICLFYIEIADIDDDTGFEDEVSSLSVE